MSNYLYSSTAVDSLIAYINDVKPYHSKLSEIVEEYQFYESMNVAINDSKRFTRTKIAGIWDSETYSNGLYIPFTNLAFTKQSKSSKYWNDALLIDSAKYDRQIPGLTDAYYLRHNIGIRSVFRNGIVQNEGVDFHVSHGAYTIDVEGSKQKYTESSLKNVVGDDASKWVKGLQLMSEPSSLYYEDVKGTNGTVTEIVPNLNASNYEEFTLKCVQVNNTTDGIKLSYEHEQVVPSSVWNIQHKLNSTNLFMQCYIVDAQTLVPISPARIEFVNANTVNVYFSSERIGKVKIIRFVDSLSTFTETFVTPEDKWHVHHNLGTTDLIYNVLVNINGSLEKINPASIDIVDDNNVIINFSSPRSGEVSLGSISSYASASFVQNQPSDTWSFDNKLRTDSGVFLVYDSNGNVVFPQDIVISKSLIYVKFSKPISGKLLFAKLFSAGNENTIFSVTGSETGLIGYARVGLKFTSQNLSFTIKPVAEDSVFLMGETYVLTPKNRIVTHKNYIDDEKWSFIKVNPIVHEKPRFQKSGTPIISNWVYKTTGIRPQVLTITHDGSVFNVVSSIDGSIGSVANGGTFSTSEFSFTIQSSIIDPVAGDYFQITVFNEAPTISDLDLTIGYDLTTYDNTEYDDHFIGFDLTSLNLTIVDPAIKTSYFELSYNGSTFDVFQYNNSTDRRPLAQYAPIVPGVPYTCQAFSITIPATVSYLTGDIFIFNVTNPDPYFNDHDVYMISNRFGLINLYPKSFIDSPAQTWTISVNGDYSVSVVGSVSGAQANGKITESYDNGFIHFTLLQTEIPFTPGDQFFITINDEKPSYLVFGEKTGFTKPLTIGKWYWNGKLGLKIDFPFYHAQEFVSVGEGKQGREIYSGSIVIDEFGNKLEFNKPPRYDARNDVYKFTPLGTKYQNQQLINVESAVRGIQRGALRNSRYIDDMRPEQSKFVGFEHHDGVIDLTITAASDLPLTPISFEIVSNDLPLYHANDLIIFNTPIGFDTVTVERETIDKIFLKTNTKNPVLGQNPSDNEDQWFPTYTVQKSPFSDESTEVDVYASLINKKVGTIKNFGGVKEQYRLEVDSDFFNEFLPFNSRLGSKVVQNEQENAVVKTRFTEKMRVFDYYRMSDTISVNLHENHAIKIDSSYPLFHDTILVSIDDKTFRGFFAGYDTSPFDIESNGYDDTTSVQNEFFSASAGGVGYLVQDKGVGNSSVSKINETMTVYSRLTSDAMGFANAYADTNLPAIDAYGWNNADVIDGTPPMDAQGWDAAVFDMVYGQNIESVTDVIYDLTAYVSKLNIPVPGSSLYGAPYTNIPSALIDVNRKIATATIMKRGLNASSVVMYSDIATQTQVSINIIENTSDYVKISVTTPSIGKIVIF